MPRACTILLFELSNKVNTFSREVRTLEEMVALVRNFGFPVAVSVYLLVLMRIEGKLGNPYIEHSFFVRSQKDPAINRMSQGFQPLAHF